MLIKNLKVSSVTSEGTDIPQKPLKEGEGDASTFTSEGSDIREGDAHRVDTQKNILSDKYELNLKKISSQIADKRKKFVSNKFEPPLKTICVTNCR